MSRKFAAAPDPIEQESQITVIEPTSEQMARELNRMVDLMYQNATPSQRKALDFWKLHHATESATTEVKLMFLRRFYFWLLGRGTKEDHARTLWGRGNAAVINDEVREYIEQFAKKRLEFALLIATMQNRVPDTLNGYYLYFKYIVNGGLKRSKAADGSTFWDMSNENFLKDFEMMQETFSPQQKPTYSDVIRPAAERPAGAPPFGWAKNELQEAPYPASKKDREKWAFNADGQEAARAAHRARQAAGLDGGPGPGQPPPPPPPAGGGGGGGGLPPAPPPFDPMEQDTEEDDVSPAAGAEQQAAAVNAQLRAEIEALLADQQRAAANIGDLREAIRRYETERGEREQLERRAEQAFEAQEVERRRLHAEVKRLSDALQSINNRPPPPREEKQDVARDARERRLQQEVAQLQAELRSRDDRPPDDGGAAVRAAVESERDRMAEELRRTVAQLKHDFDENRERMAREGRQALAAQEETARARLLEEAQRWEQQFREANQAAAAAAAEHHSASANAAARMAQQQETIAQLNARLHEMGVNFENARRAAAEARRDSAPAPPSPDNLHVHVAQHHPPAEALQHQRVNQRAKKVETVMERVKNTAGQKPEAVSKATRKLDDLQKSSRRRREEIRRNRREHAGMAGIASRAHHESDTRGFVYENATTNDEFTRAHEERLIAMAAEQAQADAAAQEARRVEEEALLAEEQLRAQVGDAVDEMDEEAEALAAAFYAHNDAVDSHLDRLIDMAAEEGAAAAAQEQEEAERVLLEEQQRETDLAEEAKAHQESLERFQRRQEEAAQWAEEQRINRERWEATKKALAEDDFEQPPNPFYFQPEYPLGLKPEDMTMEEHIAWDNLLRERQEAVKAAANRSKVRSYMRDLQNAVEEGVDDGGERVMFVEDDEGTEEDEEAAPKATQRFQDPKRESVTVLTEESFFKRFDKAKVAHAAKKAALLAKKPGRQGKKGFADDVAKILAANPVK